MTTKKGTLARNAMADALGARLNGGTLEIRTGSPPTNPGDADSGTLLAVLTFGSPAFGSAASGVITANAITQDSSANATGTAGHFRAKGLGGVVELQGTVTATGGGGDLTIDNADIVAGGVVTCSSLTYTEPV